MEKEWFFNRGKQLSAIKVTAFAVALAASTWGVLLATAGTPDWLQAAARAPLPKYPEETNAVILWSQQVTTVSDSGEIKTVFRRVYRILRPEGREFATFAVDFDSETRLTFLKAWSISGQGVEYEVKEKDAVETGLFAGGLYDDTRHKVLRIPGAEPGSLLGYEYEQKRRPMVLQDVWAFQGQIPVRRAEFVLEFPAGWEFKAHWLNHASRQPRTPGERRWVWELEDVAAVESEPSMPDWRAVAGRLAVAFFPRAGELPGKNQAAWKDVGLWYAQLASGRRQLTPEIRKKAAELAASESTLLDKIRRLAEFVQRDIRYVAIEIGIGGYQPHHARDVFLNRYGDCKDKVTLLSALLQEIGVESFYVLIHNRRGVLAPNFPSALSFNHVIIAIRLPEVVPDAPLYSTGNHQTLGRLLFFDPTDGYTPLGHLPSGLQVNHGLLVTENGGELLLLPLMMPSANRLLRAAQLTLNASGSLSGVVQEIRWGSPAIARRAQLLNSTGPERIKFVESFLGTFLPTFRLTMARAENLEKSAEALVLQLGLEAENYAQSAGNLLLLRPRVLGRKTSDLLEGKERKHPFEFSEATLETDSFEITLPSGYQVDELPPPIRVAYPFAEYNSSVEAKGDVLRYTRLYQIKMLHVPREHLAELKKFFRQIAVDERSYVVLKRTGP